MKTLGTIKKVNDLRSVWAHEEYDFSKWLSQEENLSLLSEAVGIDIVLEELESPVGGFSVDLFASEEGTGRKIIIENQLEDTNHDHLGKIITYAAGKNADVIIWVVKHARDEHRQAVAWLNQHTDSEVGFFLLEIELWQIDNSPIAPMFKVVEQPNDWAKTLKTTEGLSETRKLQLEFWQNFVDYAYEKQEFSSQFSQRKVLAQHWYDISLGRSAYHCGLTVDSQKKRIGCEIYINDDKTIFEKFKEQKDAIEKSFGSKLEWIEAGKDCRIVARTDGDIKKGNEEWQKMFDWFIASALKIKSIVEEYDK